MSAPPASATAGSSVTFSVTAKDANNNTAAGYTGTIHFTSSDPAAVLPANATLTNGAGTFTITLKTAGSQTIKAADTSNSSLTGSSSAVTVAAAAATHFIVAPNINVVNVASGQVASGISGSVSLVKITPGTATLNGPNSFSGGAYIERGELIIAAPSALPNGSSLVVGSATAFGTLNPTSSTTAGTAFTFLVVAQDAYGNTASGYAGTLQFSSSDAAAALPANATLTGGVGTFSATLKTAGSQTIAATDTANSSLTGSSGTVNVSPAAASHFAVIAPATAIAGSAVNFTVTAQDAYNNTVTNYPGTVHFTSSDSAAILPANATLNNGAGTFSVTLKTGGSQTITATDTANGSLTGSSGAVNVTASAATHFVISAPSAATAGSIITFTVTAEDATGNTATGYIGTVQFSSSDPAAVLPANTTLTNGVGTFSITLKTAGSRTITATDVAASSITGSSGAVTVSPAAVTHLVVSPPATATAGNSLSFTVTAEDAYNNAVPSYAGTVHFTSSDPTAALPANATLTGGTGTFSATLDTAGSQSILATDISNGSLTGSGSVTVNAAAATHFVVTIPASDTAGSAITVTVTAIDAYNNTATGYTGTVHFTSTDASANLPGNSQLTAGTATFSAIMETGGNQTITATDTANSSLTGTSSAVNVTLPATHFVVTVPSTATAGAAFNIQITAEDVNGNTAAGYTGTVHFSSSDSAAVLPANATLTNGVGTFSVTLNTAGSQTVSATDTVSSGLTGTSSAVSVTVASGATHFVIVASRSATAGKSFAFTVTAESASGSTAIGYNGTVQFSSSDPQAVLPANAHLINGTATFTVTLKTAGNQTITATDTSNSSLTGTSGAVNVTAAAASQFVIDGPSGTTQWSAAAGNAFTFTVTAEDPYGNAATSYSGSIHFSSSDSAASLPGNKTLTGGTGTFTATLNTLGSQTITATDTTNGSLTGSGTVNVTSVNGPVEGAASPEAVGFNPASQPSSPPSVIMQTPPSTVEGDVIITYALVDTNQNPCNIQVQFSSDGGNTWQNATTAPGGDGTHDLATSIAPPGFVHEYLLGQQRGPRGRVQCGC